MSIDVRLAPATEGNYPILDPQRASGDARLTMPTRGGRDGREDRLAEELGADLAAGCPESPAQADLAIRRAC